MSVFESFLKAGAGLDWISPLLAIVQNYRNRPSVGYCVPIQTGWITDVLQAKGVKVWGLVVVDDELVFSVRLRQARYTQYWLEKEGVAYRGGITLAENGPTDKLTNNNQKLLGCFDKTITNINKFINKI